MIYNQSATHKINIAIILIINKIAESDPLQDWQESPFQ